MLIKNLSDSIFTLWVDAQSSGSFSTIFTLPTSPYKIIYSDAKRHGCYFKNYYYYNIWIIHVQSPTNLPKSMWKLRLNIVNVIF